MMPPSLPLEDDEHTTKADRNGASVLNLLLSGEANIIHLKATARSQREHKNIDSRRSILATTLFSL